MHSTVSNPNPHHQDCVWSCEYVSHFTLGHSHLRPLVKAAVSVIEAISTEDSQGPPEQQVKYQTLHSLNG